MLAAPATRRGAPHGGSCEPKGRDGCGEDEPNAIPNEGGENHMAKKAAKKAAKKGGKKR